MRDIASGEDAQVAAVVETVRDVTPDILVLQGFDWDYEGRALAAFNAQLGGFYPHRLALKPNTGRMTQVDLNGDGRRFDPQDAQGYGAFTGQAGMAVLSRYPIDAPKVQDFSDVLWRDLPEAQLPYKEGKPFPSAEAHSVQRLSSVAHWVVPIDVPQIGRVSLLTWHGSTPAFDGPEDRNGRRGGDEARFWQVFLDGHFGAAPDRRFVLAGVSNIDPSRGDGQRAVMAALLSDPRLLDPPGLRAATVKWARTGPLRVSYILPSKDWSVASSGITPENMTASRHRLIWVELTP